MVGSGPVSRRAHARLGRRVALAAGSAAVGLLLLEGAGRAFLWSRGDHLDSNLWELDPVLGTRMRAGFAGSDDQGAFVRVNRLGLRGPEAVVPKPGGAFRVVAVGDSITYGFGVAEEETYCARLGPLLAERGIAGAEVINAGVNGYSTLQGELLLERVVLGLEPDVVVFSFMNNDRFDANGRPQSEGTFAEQYAAARWRFFLYNRTALGRIAIRLRSGGLEALLARPDHVREREFAGRARIEPAELPAPERSVEGFGPDDPRTRELFDGMHGTPAVPPLDRARLHERAADACARRGIRFVLLQFWNNPHHAESLRAATEALDAGRPDEALERLRDYFRTVPIPGTSCAMLADFDGVANLQLLRAYDAKGIVREHRRYFHPRGRPGRVALYQDLEYNRVTATVARQRNLAVVDFRDLEIRDYLDQIHLSPAGHERVAARLADVLDERR